jgi:hypothetical protein
MINPEIANPHISEVSESANYKSDNFSATYCRFIWAVLVRMTADNFERFVYVKEMHARTMRLQIADEIVQI